MAPYGTVRRPAGINRSAEAVALVQGQGDRAHHRRDGGQGADALGGVILGVAAGSVERRTGAIRQMQVPHPAAQIEVAHPVAEPFRPTLGAPGR